MSLNSQQKQHLRGLAHHLKPVLMVGDKGVTDNLLAELEQVLENHELIKVTIAADREERRQVTEVLCAASGAESVQMIGRISVLYRAAREPHLVIPA